MKLNDLNTTPPGMWRFKHIDTGFVSRGTTFKELVGKVAQYRRNRNEPIVSEGYVRIEDEVEDEICQALSPEDQIAHCNTTWRQTNGIHWREVARFLHTLAAWLKAGFRLVPQDIAEKRAAICAKCPLNVGMTGCAVCRTSLKAGKEALMQRTTANDDKLQSCAVCGCLNSAQVHVPLEVLDQGAKNLSYPSWCWKNPAFVGDAVSE